MDVSDFVNPTTVPYIAGTASFLFSLLSYHAGKVTAGRYFDRNLESIIASKNNALLVKGEQIGFEKGFECGLAEARNNLRLEMATFLEDQVKQLRGVS